MAVVLTDGNPSSLKALDLAFTPSFLVNHDEDQLMIVHGWSDPKDLQNLAPVHGAIDHIGKSRVAQTTLNYKLEMVKLEGQQTSTEGESSVQPTPTPTPQPSSPSKEKSKTGAKGKSDKDAEAEAAAAASAAEAKVELTVAQQVAQYAVERSQHHKTNAIVLGVGNSQVGKSVSVGSVCRELVSQHRPDYNLFCMKASGPTVRPTAAMRMMVLVVPGTSLDHLKYALSVCSIKKNDRIGVMIVVNNGKPKPAEGVSHMNAEAYDEDGVMTIAELTRRCTAMLADFGLTETATSDPDAAPSAAASESFPLINHVALEPTNTNPTPTVDESGLQLVKLVGGLKVDFFVLPPKREGAVSDNYLQLVLAAPKPHLLLTKD